ncbi:endolytic transglycosylase MltG [Paenibacillus marinisediminis]
MKTGLKVFLVIIGLLVLLAAGGTWYAWNEMQPMPKQDQTVRVEIERGSVISTIANQLETNGIIQNSLLFQGYLKYHKEGSKFQAGTYDFKPGMTYDEIIAKLNAGDVVKEEMVRFTIPEGYTVEQIADKLNEEGIVTKDEFLKAAEKIQASGKLPYGAVPSKQAKYPLEGYLFPSTYEMKVGSTAEDIINRMLQEMEKRIAAIPNWEADMKQRGLDLNGLLTVASLIEREVVVDEERALVAGVIYNRIDQGMKLQIDATVQYALDEPKERLYYKDLEIDSPYNTYKIEGLPPGPIANPSIASIEAALKPEASEYLFYVTKKDGSNTHLFAKTFAEHEKNIQKSKQ